jgi:hypothetical protein
MSRVLVITGMHRSGTSLIASLCERAGLPLGAQQLAPGADNPFGYFEDAEFFQFHEDALHTREQNILVTREFAFVPTAAEMQRAHALIAARAPYPLWGWKDPRTTLFLDFWDTQLERAQYVFVYRHPFDVILSLARRGEVVGFDFYAGLEAWYAYNARLLEFADRQPGRSLVVSSYAAVAAIDQFQSALANRFRLDLALDASVRDAIYRQEHLRRVQTDDELLMRIHPEAMTVYRELQARNAVPAAPDTEPRPDTAKAVRAFADQLATPLPPGQRRALLNMLVALADTELFESFARGHVTRTRELENQRRAWQVTAEERARALDAQSAWAQPRIEYLKRLERSRGLRALVRFGFLPHSTEDAPSRDSKGS